MKREILVRVVMVALFLTVVTALPSSSNQVPPSSKVLDMSNAPTVPRESHGRSVNLSFFVPAFSLFALASQFMPQMFPTLTTTTTSRNARARRDATTDWLDTAISNGLLF